MATRTARILGGVGRTLITAGVLVLLFAAFQVWGTSLAEDRAQDALADAFQERRAALAATTPATVAVPPTTTAPAPQAPADEEPEPQPDPEPVPAAPLPPELVPELGDTVGRIVIPAIGVDKYVVEGVRRADLRRGPGHFPETPLPGQAGNAAIAGHRTTYGAPFGDLDRLVPGDEILVETLQGTFRYRVLPHEGPDGTEVGHFIVDPYAGVAVLEDHGDDRLTLTACHPKYSAAQRIVVTAELAGAPAPATEAVAEGEVAGAPATDTGAGAPATDTGAGGDDAGAGGDDAGAGSAEPGGGAGSGTDEGPAGVGGSDPPDGGADAAADGEDASQPDGEDGRQPGDVELGEAMGWNLSGLPTTAAWAGLTALAAAVVAVAGRRWRRWPAWAVGGPVVGLALFVTFGHLDRMLPAL